MSECPCRLSVDRAERHAEARVAGLGRGQRSASQTLTVTLAPGHPATRCGSRSTKTPITAAAGGATARSTRNPPRYAHRRAASSRCRRSNVAGLTIRLRHSRPADRAPPGHQHHPIRWSQSRPADLGDAVPPTSCRNTGGSTSFDAPSRPWRTGKPQHRPHRGIADRPEHLTDHVERPTTPEPTLLSPTRSVHRRIEAFDSVGVAARRSPARRSIVVEQEFDHRELP